MHSALRRTASFRVRSRNAQIELHVTVASASSVGTVLQSASGNAANTDQEQRTSRGPALSVEAELGVAGADASSVGTE